MKDVEKAGLVKFDFLGLKTLTVMRPGRGAASRAPRRADSSLAVDPARRRRRPTSCCRAARRPACSSSNRAACATCCSKLKPDRFEDIIAAGRALPARARWTTSRRLHRPSSTARAARVPAPAARADPEGDLRRHRLPGAGDADRPGAGRLHARRRRPAAPRHGQEDQAEMDAQREALRRGRRQERRRGRTAPSRSSTWWRSSPATASTSRHAAAYALLAYQTAYLKANYPVEFFAAAMTTEMANAGEARGLPAGHAALPPPPLPAGRQRVAAPVHGRGHAEGTGVRYALAAIKGVGADAIEALVEERKANGPFDDAVRPRRAHRPEVAQPPPAREPVPGRRLRRAAPLPPHPRRLRGPDPPPRLGRGRRGGRVAGQPVRRRAAVEAAAPAAPARRRLADPRAAPDGVRRARPLPLGPPARRLRRGASPPGRSDRRPAARRSRRAGRGPGSGSPASSSPSRSA